MGSGINMQLFVIQMVFIILLSVIIVNIMKFIHAHNLERRIGKYAMDPIDGEIDSIADGLNRVYNRTIRSISMIIGKSFVIKKYANRYNKYIVDLNDDKINTVDYVSIKILLIGVFLVVLSLSNILRYQTFTFIQFFLSFIVGFFLPDIILAINEKRRIKKIDEDMFKAIVIMNSAFKSGKTTMQAVEIVKNELSGPIGEEFKKMYTDISFGLDLDTVFERFSKRIDTDDARYISASLTILNKTGGDIVKIFSSIEKSFFNRRKLQSELKSLTSSSQLMFRVLIISPFIMFIVLYILNPVYFNPLFSTTPGIIVSGLIMIIFILYIYFVRRVMKVRL